MNKKGLTGIVGFSLISVLFVFIIVLFVTIEPFKETLNTVRGGDHLNCRGVSDFNQTKYDHDSNDTIHQLTRRPTCFATGISMVWWVLAFLIAAFAWVVRNWRRVTK